MKIITLSKSSKIVIIFFNFVKGFLDSNSDVLKLAESNEIYNTEGSTATVLLLKDDDLFLGYVGDSSAILIKGNSSVNLCEDIDIPEVNKLECQRIENLGGVVLRVGQTLRLQGEIGLTRALGDAKYKKFLLAEPHLTHLKLEEKCRYIVLATDGLWKYLNISAVITLVLDNSELSECQIAELLHQSAMENGCMDNATIVVINLYKRKLIGNKFSGDNLYN